MKKGGLFFKTQRENKTKMSFWSTPGDTFVNPKFQNLGNRLPIQK